MRRASDRKRCATHHVVLDPQGHCILCRRTEPEKSSWQPLGLAVGGVLVVSALLMFGWIFRSAEPTAPVEATGTQPALREQSTTGPLQGTAGRDVAPTEPPASSVDPWALAFDIPDAAPEGGDGGRIAIEEPADGGTAPLTKEQRQAIDEAMRRVPVKVYITEDCPLCIRTVNWLRMQRYQVQAFDVDRDPSAKLSMLELNVGESAPAIEIEGVGLAGFSPSAIRGELQRAAQAKLRDEAQAF